MKETEKSFEIIHPSGKRIHYIINHPDEIKRENPPELDIVRLRTDNLSETQEWAKVMEQVVGCPSHYLLMLPRHPSLEAVSEKCHWFNTFMNRYFKDIENYEVLNTMFKNILIRKFERLKKPDYIVGIKLLFIIDIMIRERSFYKN